MIRSMTGFGSGSAKSTHGAITVEIKTVNHKFLEITPRLPNSLSLIEDKVKAQVQKGVKRGKVYLNLMHEGVSPHSESLYVDTGLAKNYFKKLKKLNRLFDLDATITLRDIVSYPGVINYRATTKEAAKLWPLMHRAINRALNRLIRDREREGRHMITDIKKRLRKIKHSTQRVNAKADINVRKYKRKLERRIREISGVRSVNSDRLEMEVALYAKNSDVTEEIIRMTGHLHNFDHIIKNGGEVGKKLDFVAQEMHREANTIGSKSGDYAISRSVIEMKSEIEKIREQVKNIE